MPLVKIESVTKSFKGREVIADASGQIEEGKITAIVGVNGSGKSLLFRMICGFARPDRGEIWVNPKYLSQNRDYPERFGIIIDKPGFLPSLTGLANLEALAAIRKEISRDQITATMRIFGLDPNLKQKVRHYSLGMKQKLALIQAFMENPEVLLLDEPFNALDSDSVVELRSRLLEFRNAGGTVIFTSHNEADVEALADEIYELRNGQLLKRLPNPSTI